MSNGLNKKTVKDKNKIIDDIASSPNILENKENAHFILTESSEVEIIPIIERNPSLIVYVKKPSYNLYMLAFNKDRSIYPLIYDKAPISMLVDAIAYDPSNIRYASELGIFDHMLYEIASLAILSNECLINNSYVKSCCIEYLRVLTEYEKGKAKKYSN